MTALRYVVSILCLAPDSGAAVEHLRRQLPHGAARDLLALRAVRLLPGDIDVRLNAGTALLRSKRPAEAARELLAVIVLDPGRAEAWGNAGALTVEIGRPRSARSHFRRALAIDPARAGNWINAATHAADFDDACRKFAAAAALAPDFADAWYNFANALIPAGFGYRGALAAERATRLNPAPDAAFSNWLFSLHYSEAWPAGRIAAAHRAFGDFFPARPVSIGRRGDALRIGYVSPDFGQHSIAAFLPGVLAAHRAEVTLYSNRPQRDEDAVTAVYRRTTARFRIIAGQSDAEVAEAVAKDDIDVLVDLAGHTGGNRLGVFARAPAPLQASWLGYPDTTGLSAIDLRLTDAIADPPGTDDAAETLARIEGGFLAYRGPDDIPQAPPPCLTNGWITFGSFNNLAKLTRDHATAFAEILRRTGRARLILKAHGFGDPATRRHWQAFFSQAGCRAQDIELLSWVENPLAAYGRIDIALDTYPYSGTTTTCDAFWMGVPVVSRIGDRHAGRMGASLLSRVGLADLAVTGREAFIETAVALARDRARLVALRTGLRTAIKDGPLGDAERMARAMEDLFRR